MTNLSPDPRTDKWLLLGSPWPIVALFVVYMGAVWLGPRVMKRRDPVPLKWVIIPYNLGLVVLSVYMAYEVGIQEWSTHSLSYIKRNTAISK